MDIDFFGFLARMPDGWDDRSTITFQAPVDQKLATPLASKGGVSPGNVVINWADAPKSARAALDQLDAQVASMPTMFNGFKLLTRGDVGAPDDPVPFAEIEFDAGGRTVRQILFTRVVGDRIVAVTGTALDVQFKSLRAVFVDVVKSIRAR